MLKTTNIYDCKILYILFLLLFSCSDSITDLLDSIQSIKIDWTEKNTIVCYGNSLTEGLVGVDSSYPALLDKKLKIKVINHGESGATSQYGVDNLETIFDSNPVLVLLEFGANDFFQGDSVSHTRENMIFIIEQIKQYGSEVALLNFAHPNMINCIFDNPVITHYIPEDTIHTLIDIGLEFDRMLDSLALNYELLYEDYLLEGIFCDSTLLSKDGIHPNGRGNMRMAENIYNEFYKVFEISGMLK